MYGGMLSRFFFFFKIGDIPHGFLAWGGGRLFPTAKNKHCFSDKVKAFMFFKP